MRDWYKEDLPYVHDVGYGNFALESALSILEILDQSMARQGLVVDLGCGSGLWARELTKAHYCVLGVDISESMIDIARKRVPEAEFRIGSLFEADIPPCEAVTSLGECLNYMFDSGNDCQTLVRFFRCTYDSLAPGGVFVFGIVEPGQVTPRTTTRGFSEGEDWAVLLAKEEDLERGLLTRHITSFRKVGKCYRRADEVHRLRLYKSRDVARELRRAGFLVRVMNGYGQYRLPRAYAAFVATKPP